MLSMHTLQVQQVYSTYMYVCRLEKRRKNVLFFKRKTNLENDQRPCVVSRVDAFSSPLARAIPLPGPRPRMVTRSTELGVDSKKNLELKSMARTSYAAAQNLESRAMDQPM
jgi:hypothetical protein